ncbi:ribosomal protein S18-alanine N-acetyltransferase [Gemmatimonas sp.]|uniref:ribosomal protein S18-alanine N-acetyltransferase n=1 Tax=Gemmatimonas sp. TaxID=1962908 RepID=UPI00356A460D
MSTPVIAIRPTSADDVPAMATIEALAFSDPWPARSFHELLLHPFSRMATAVDESGGIVGYCIMLRAVDEAEIANIATAPGVRRQGVGAQLLDDAIAAGTADGVVAMFLEVRESNTAARALYSSRGFVAVGRRRAYYRHPVEDALVLRRDATAFE